MTNLKKVELFHRKFMVPVLDQPSARPPSEHLDRTALRFKLMDEELQEYRTGTGNEDIVEIFDALLDMQFVLYGSVLEHGLQDLWQRGFNEVYRSNMTKKYGEGKMVKDDDYSEPDLDSILAGDTTMRVTVRPVKHSPRKVTCPCCNKQTPINSDPEIIDVGQEIVYCVSCYEQCSYAYTEGKTKYYHLSRSLEIYG